MSRVSERTALKDHRGGDVQEHRLSADVARYRRTLLESFPGMGKTELQRRVDRYRLVRRRELGLGAASTKI